MLKVEERLFKEAVRKGLRQYTESPLSYFVMYKGFKLVGSKEGDYKLYDVRFNDFYSKVKESDLSVLRTLGLVRGADTLMYNRDISRSDICKKDIANLYDKMINIYKPMIKEGINLEFYNKRVRNAYSNIHDYTDLIFFYKNRIELYESKYSIKNSYYRRD